MEWQDEGVVLAARRHGDSSLIASLLTLAHGRCAGLVRGGAGRRARPVFQPGNRLRVTWRARLAEHLGSFTAELEAATGAGLLDDPLRLAALSSTCALLETTLPERDPHPNLYGCLIELLDILASSGQWSEAYVRFEVELLAELGFGLDLDVCAVTGQPTDLAYVSPRTGRAVSRAGAGRYAPRLLPLPAFLIGAGPADRDQILQGLHLTGMFLRQHVYEPAERSMPVARERLIARLGNPR